MAERLMDYGVLVPGPDGNHQARACARQRDDGSWEAWFEFDDLHGVAIARTERETTASSRANLFYWASGISAVYLEGALARAAREVPPRLRATSMLPAFDAPYVRGSPLEEGPVTEEAASPFDPFGLYASGQVVLRRRLERSSVGHLRHIARDYDMLDEAMLAMLTKEELVEAILAVAQASAPVEQPRAV